MDATTSYLYDAVLSPFYDRLTAFLWPDWIHPNWITILGAAACAVADRALNIQHPNDDKGAVMAFWGWTFYHMCDNMDGKHARRTGQASSLGGFLDHAVDGFYGAWVGYRVVAGVVFGLDENSGNIFDAGRHNFFCLWLSPHIVRKLHVHEHKRLALGTKWCSVDEGFLLVSGLLLYRAWIHRPDASAPLLPCHLNSLHGISWAIAGTALVYVILFAIRLSQISNPWAICFVAFWGIGLWLSQDEQLWWMLWTPYMMLNVWHLEKGQKDGLSQSPSKLL